MDLKNSHQRQAGFTLSELMIVVAIIGILAAFAIPNFLAWLPGYRLKSAVRDLQSDFQMAKLEAVKRGANVAIEFITGAYAPAGRIGGYVIFADPNTNRIFDAGDTLISQVAMPANVSLTASNFPLNARVNPNLNPAIPPNQNPAMSFVSRGLPNPAAGAGTVTTRNNQNISGQIVINLTGRVRIARSISTDGGVTWPAYQQWD